MNTILAEAFIRAGFKADGEERHRSPKRGRRIPRNNNSEMIDVHESTNAKSAVEHKAVNEGVAGALNLLVSLKDFDQVLELARAAKAEGVPTEGYAEMADKLGHLNQWNALIWIKEIGDLDVVGHRITTPATRHMLGLTELPEHAGIESTRSLRSTLQDLLA